MSTHKITGDCQPKFPCHLFSFNGWAHFENLPPTVWRDAGFTHWSDNPKDQPPLGEPAPEGSLPVTEDGKYTKAMKCIMGDDYKRPGTPTPSLQSVAEGAAFYSQDDIETLITCDGRGVAEKRKSLAAIQARHIFCLAERDDRIKELNEVREAELVSCESRFAEFRKHAWEQQAALRTEIGRLEKELAAEKKSSRQAIDMGVANEFRLEAALTERDERIGRLEEAREDALQALGEHPESETDLAQRIREIRQEGRDLFHDLTALRTSCEELQRDKERLEVLAAGFERHLVSQIEHENRPAIRDGLSNTLATVRAARKEGQQAHEKGEGA